MRCRVHLDVLTDAVESVLALGARPAPGYGGDPWTVLLDPEGGELCAFVFGVETENDGDPWWSIGGIPGLPMDAIVFDPVPEPKR